MKMYKVIGKLNNIKRVLGKFKTKEEAITCAHIDAISNSYDDGTPTYQIKRSKGRQQKFIVI
jgi:hypothetical protein